jgi:hypothetical protein
MANINPGPAVTSTPNTQANMGAPGATSSSGGAGLFPVSITAALAGTVDNWSPPLWVPGVTNFINLVPTGTPTINGIVTAGMGQGFSFLVYNSSATLTINFANLAGTSLVANQIACPQATTVALGPQTWAIMTFNGNNLIFAG